MADSIAYGGLGFRRKIFPLATAAPSEPSGPSGPGIPIVTAVSYDVIHTAGNGEREVATVDSSVGCTALKIGGVACTSFAIDDATHVSGIPGAHAAGVVDVVVTNAAGDSTTGTGLVTYFDPASLTATAYLLDYAGAPWNGTASAGTSGVNAFSVGVAPTVGANFSAHPSADLDGTMYLVGPTIGDLVSLTAYTLDFIVEMDTANAPSGSGYSDTLLLGDITNGEFYVRFNTSGFAAGHYDAPSYIDTPYVAFGTGTKAHVQVRFNGTDLKIRVNGGAWTAPAATTTLRAGCETNTLDLGNGYAATMPDGRFARFMSFATALSDANMDLLNGIAKQQFGTP